MKRISFWAVGVASAIAIAFASSSADASVKLEGSWPDADKTISIDAAGLARSEAVRKIAEAAGWNIVVHAPPGDPIDLHVKSQPAVKVLNLVLDDASYVATRDGSLVSIEREKTEAPAASVTPSTPPTPTPTPAATPAIESAAPPLPPPPAASASAPPAPPPVPSVESRGEDRLVTGGNLRIEKDETAKDVTVLGGSVDVFGNVTGDLTVIAGSAHVHKDAHVHRDATAIGGSLDIEDGAVVDGDVGVVGGVLSRAPGAKIHGDIVEGKHVKKDVKVDLGESNDDLPSFSLHRTIRGIGGALTRSAILFVFGAMLLALATDRMERLRAEIAARPMRSFALGLIGSIAACLATVVLCVTVIGIPIAVVGLLLAVFGGYAGFCAALATGGQALFGHRTKNPYVHLALGCLLLIVLEAIPYVGTWIFFTVAFIGIGALVATRGAGIGFGKARISA